MGPYSLPLPYLEPHGHCIVRLPPSAHHLPSPPPPRMSQSTDQRLPYSCSSLYSIFLRSTLLILPLWVLRWTAFDVALILFSAGSCSIIQDLDAGGIGPVAMVLHALFSGIFLPVYTSCEALIKAYAILYPSKGFHVIEKV